MPCLPYNGGFMSALQSGSLSADSARPFPLVVSISGTQRCMSLLTKNLMGVCKRSRYVCADWCDVIYIYINIYWLTVYTDRQTES